MASAFHLLPPSMSPDSRGGGRSHLLHLITAGMKTGACA
jgi:hypothetical protein